MSEKEYYRFWKSVNRANNSKAVKYASVIDGCSGDNAIVDRWHSHFEDLCNFTRDIMSEVQFRARVPLNVNVSFYKTFIEVSGVAFACKNQKCGKATGPDDMAMDALINGTLVRIDCMYIWLFFLIYQLRLSTQRFHAVYNYTSCENKAGDVSHLNNYGAIALSPVLSKLFECVLEKFLSSQNIVDNHQFGFKRGHSTSLCTNALKQTVDYTLAVAVMFLLVL